MQAFFHSFRVGNSVLLVFLEDLLTNLTRRLTRAPSITRVGAASEVPVGRYANVNIIHRVLIMSPSMTLLGFSHFYMPRCADGFMGPEKTITATSLGTITATRKSCSHGTLGVMS